MQPSTYEYITNRNICFSIILYNNLVCLTANFKHLGDEKTWTPDVYQCNNKLFHQKKEIYDKILI